MVEPSEPAGALIGFGFVLAILVVAFVLAGCDSGPPKSGPLACRECFGTGSSITIDVGRRGTNGVTVLENTGSQVAVLDRVSLRERSPDLRVLGPFVIRVGDLPRTGLAAGVIDGFPPRVTRGILHPVRGFKVQPYRGRSDAVELLVGFQVPHEGEFSYRGVDVHYHVGMKNYVAFYPDAFAVCVPRSFEPSECHAPGY